MDADIISSRRLSIATRRRTYRATDLKDVQIACRALVHGFARMNIDGHRTLFIDDITRRQSRF
jgi:hypothetical protein